MSRPSCWFFAALLCTVPIAGPAWAEFKPTHPIDLVVHGGPGSGNDVFGRAIIAAIEHEKLSPVRIQISNRPGGGSTTAAAFMAGKSGDSHTIAVFTNVWLTDPLVQKEAKVTMRELTPVARMVVEPALVAVRAESPFKSLKEFVAAAKEKPGQLKQSGGSITSRENIIRQMIMKETGANWTFISFPSGGERLAALLGGHVDLMILDPSEALSQVKSGKLRVLAQIAEKRLPEFKDIPTVPEAGFHIPNVPQTRGIVGPPNMPAEALAYYETMLEKLVNSPSWKKFVDDNFLEASFAKSQETRKFLEQYEDSIREQLKMVGAKVVR